MTPRLAAATTTGPLAGARVWVTRQVAEDRIAAALEDAGAEVVAAALTETVPGDPAAIAEAEARLAAGCYAWVVLTSARTLTVMDLAALPASTHVAVVGPATARGICERSISMTSPYTRSASSAHRPWAFA